MGGGKWCWCLWKGHGQTFLGFKWKVCLKCRQKLKLLNCFVSVPSICFRYKHVYMPVVVFLFPPISRTKFIVQAPMLAVVTFLLTCLLSCPTPAYMYHLSTSLIHPCLHVPHVHFVAPPLLTCTACPFHCPTPVYMYHLSVFSCPTPAYMFKVLVKCSKDRILGIIPP